MTLYTVKSGDSLSKIAVTYYGTYNNIGTWNPVTALAQANGIANINVITPGQKLIIPDGPIGNSPVPAKAIDSTTGSSSTSTTTTTITKPAAPATGSNKIYYYLGGAVLLAAITAMVVNQSKKKKKKK